MSTSGRRPTRRTAGLAAAVAAAGLIAVSGAYMKGRWGEFRRKAEYHETLEHGYRLTAGRWEREARRCAGPFASPGAYLDGFPGSSSVLPDDRFAWVLAENDPDRAPLPVPEFLEVEARRCREFARSCLADAEHHALEARVYRRRWW